MKTLCIISGGQTGVDRGTQWTIECASDMKKPLLVADPFEKGSKEMIMGWLCSIPVSILNVAGPSEMVYPGIFKTTHDLLVEVFQMLRQLDSD